MNDEFIDKILSYTTTSILLIGGTNEMRKIIIEDLIRMKYYDFLKIERNKIADYRTYITECSLNKRRIYHNKKNNKKDNKKDNKEEKRFLVVYELEKNEKIKDRNLEHYIYNGRHLETQLIISSDKLENIAPRYSESMDYLIILPHVIELKDLIFIPISLIDGDQAVEKTAKGFKKKKIIVLSDTRMLRNLQKMLGKPQSKIYEYKKNRLAAALQIIKWWQIISSKRQLQRLRLQRELTYLPKIGIHYQKALDSYTQQLQ